MATGNKWSARPPWYFRKPVEYLFFTQLSPPHHHQKFPRGVFSLISGRLIFHFPRFTVCQRCGGFCSAADALSLSLSLRLTCFVKLKLFNVLLITRKLTYTTHRPACHLPPPATPTPSFLSVALNKNIHHHNLVDCIFGIRLLFLRSNMPHKIVSEN